MTYTGIFWWPSERSNRSKTAIPGSLPPFNIQMFADGDKTEEPTAKKRADARKKGQVGRSQELSAAFVLLAGFFTLRMLWEHIYTEIYDYAFYIFGHLDQTIDVESVMQLLLGILIVLVKTSLPVMFAIMIIGLGINIAQVGFMINTEAMEFQHLAAEVQQHLLHRWLHGHQDVGHP